MFLNDAVSRKALKAALALPGPLSKQIIAYIGLFRPGKRSLTWDRVEKLLSELLEPIQSGKLTRKTQTHVVTIEIWQAALVEVIGKREKLNLPLKTHGLLFEIAASLANKQAAAAEVKREEQLRNKPKLGIKPEHEDEDPQAAFERAMEKYGRTDLIIKPETTGGTDHE
ncbi:MAG: hypothetical protein AB2604_10730 [Candidatus Thiodiazotropha taylori]